jgi:hypothetical protein
VLEDYPANPADSFGEDYPDFEEQFIGDWAGNASARARIKSLSVTDRPEKRQSISTRS